MLLQRVRYLFPAALFLIAASFGLSGCGSESAGQDKPAAQGPPPQEVVVETMQRRDIPLDMSFMGQTAGSREVEVRARVGGILLRRNYVEGGPVRQGDVMFEIDPAPFEAALEQARGALGQAEAKLAQARRDYGRMETLFKGDVVARKDIDDAQTAQESAKAAVDEAKGRLRQAELNLEWTKVTAPISGQTSREARSEGSLVTTGGEDSLLTTLHRVDPIYVNFSMSGPEVLRLRRLREEGKVAIAGDGDYVVRLVLPDGREYEQPGRINFTDTQVDETTGVVKVRAVFPNPESKALPGQFVRVRLEGAYYVNALSAPQPAVLNTQQGTMVWTLDKDNVVQPRIITLGDAAGNVYLVEKGLAEGDRIITEGVISVRPGMTVRVRGEGPTQDGAPQAAGGRQDSQAPGQPAAKEDAHS